VIVMDRTAKISEADRLGGRPAQRADVVGGAGLGSSSTEPSGGFAQLHHWAVLMNSP